MKGHILPYIVCLYVVRTTAYTLLLFLLLLLLLLP
jgi:hypothetical protein